MTGEWRKWNCAGDQIEEEEEEGRACGMCGEEEKYIGCKVLWGKPEGKRPCGRWDNNRMGGHAVE